MASKQAKAAYRREVAFFDKFRNALMTRDPQLIMSAIRSMAPGLRPVMERMAQDYVTWGGLTPETARFVQSYTPKIEDQRHDQHGAEIRMGQETVGQLTRQLAQTMPQITPGQAGEAPTISLSMRPGDVSPEDFARYMMTNRALQFMDPTTRRETQLYMSRENPYLFGGFSMYGEPSAPAPTQQTMLSPAEQAKQLEATATGLDWNALYSNLPELTRASMGPDQSGQSASKWLQEYLRTAAKGTSGTRAEQQFAARHLKTMEEEAAAQPALTNWVTLAQNLVNPVLGRSGQENLLGQGRGVTPPPGAEFKRKGIYRNIALT